jgi:hypothetical protein
MFGPQLNSMHPQSFKIDQNHQGLQRKYPGMESPGLLGVMEKPMPLPEITQ